MTWPSTIVICLAGSGDGAGPVTTAPLVILNSLPWQGQSMVPLVILFTMQPTCVHTALNALYWPLAGWVTKCIFGVIFDQPLLMSPGGNGGTNWAPMAYSPRTGLFYLSAWEDYASVFVKEEQKYEEGRRFVGGRPTSPIPGGQNIPSLKRGPINVWTEAAGHGAVIAIDPRTGDKKWKFLMTDVTDSGILTTASDLLFAGGREGYFHALDARTGELLWNVSLGGQVASGPMTYQVDGKQYISVAAGHSLFTFALRE